MKGGLLYILIPALLKSASIWKFCSNYIRPETLQLHQATTQQTKRFIFRVPLEPIHLCFTQFWELDTDHDFFVTKEDLLRYGNHSLTYRIVDRIFSQVDLTTFTRILAFSPLRTSCPT